MASMTEPIPGFECAGPSRADRADPARRRAARGRDPQRHAAAALGLGLRLWLAGLVLWAIGHVAAVWAAKRDPAVRRRGAPASAHLRPSRASEARHDEPCRISPHAAASPITCPGPLWSAQASSSTRTASFQRTARFRGPDLDFAAPAELVAVAGRLNNALRRLGSGWAIFVEAQRHAAQRYPESRFPMRPPRWSMPSARRAIRGGGRALSSPAIT